MSSTTEMIERAKNKHSSGGIGAGSVTSGFPGTSPIFAAVNATKKEAEDTRIAAAQTAVLNMPAATDQYGNFLLEISPDNYAALGSTRARDAIAAAVCAQTQKMPSKAAVEAFEIHIRNNTRALGRKITTCRRVAQVDGAVVVDLGDGRGQVVIVDGKWRVVESSGAVFLRGRGYGSLPVPVSAGLPRDAMRRVIRWLNKHGIPRGRLLLVVVVLCSWLRPGSAYPMLNLAGPAGSGKSIQARMKVDLIDPTESGMLPSIVLKEESIIAAAQSRHLATADNASRLSTDVQDILCIASTGGEIMARLLYSNGDVATMPLHCPVLITSITPVATRADLASRAITVELTARNERRDESEILMEFEEERAELLGALLDLLAAGLASDVIPPKHGHRLAEFVTLGTRICVESGLGLGEFVEAMDSMRSDTGEDLAAGDAFTTAIREEVEKQTAGAVAVDRLPGWRSWWGVGFYAAEYDGQSVFLARAKWIFEEVIRRRHGLTDARAWLPKNAHEVDGALMRATPTFEAVGVRLEKISGSDGHPYWRFTCAHTD